MLQAERCRSPCRRSEHAPCAKFVLTAVSSINTNRAGSSMPCSRIQRRRARATSARCRSAACRLFLRVIPWRSRKRQSELRLVRIRRLRSSATVSTKVRSGCWAIRSSICSANSSSGETLPPRGFGTALLLSTSAAATLPPNSRSPRNVQPSRAATHRLQQLRLRVPADHQNRTSASPAPATENQCTKICSSLTLWESRRFKSAGTALVQFDAPSQLRPGPQLGQWSRVVENKA